MTKDLFLWIPLALVAGGIIGAWGPNEELRTYKVRAVKSEPAKIRQQGFDAFARVVNIPDVARKRRFHKKEKTSTVASADVKTSEVAQVAPGNTNETSRSARQARPLNPEDLRVRIEEAAELWRTRSDLVFADTVKKLDLDAHGEARLQEIIAQMNDEILSSVRTIAETLAEEEAMTPELGVRLMGDLSATVAQTYERIGECAGEKRRADVSRLNLTDFIDPMVAEPLIGVQHKLDVFPPRRFRQ
jgi:hypothetical protein